MRKYILVVIISLLVGYFMSKAIYIDYQSEKALSYSKKYYFLNIADFDSYDDMITSSSKIGRYIYIEEDKYYTFKCISKSLDNINKAYSYYKDLGDIKVKEYYLNDPILDDVISKNDKEFEDVEISCYQSIDKYKEG